MPTTRNLAILIFEDVEVLDCCGPFEVFSVANCLIETWGLLGGLERDDLVPQVALALHAWPPLLLSQPTTSLPLSSIALVAKP